MEQEILQLKLKHPDWGYRKISEQVGCHRDTVRYHLSSHRRGYLRSVEKSKRRAVKERLVKLAGGKCIICGYSKCIAALQFHHRDRSVKSECVSNMRESAARAEIKHCDLLCANCHCEGHEGITHPKKNKTC